MSVVLPGAVRAEQGEDRAALDREVELVEHRRAAVGLAQAAHVDGWIHGDLLLSFGCLGRILFMTYTLLCKSYTELG